jgi:ATP-dependent DNA helicase RecQ
MRYDAQRSLQLLREGTKNPSATFRDDQEQCIQRVVEGGSRLLVVQRTGWGKSFVYFISTKLLREQGEGPTLLISPLLALMRNQLQAASRMGLRAATINTDNKDNWEDIEEQIREDQIDLLVISPERLANDQFMKNVMGRIISRVSLLVVDEAHCISDWGHDFRPHYRQLARLIPTLPPSMRLLATTATANDRVMQDLEQTLGPNLHSLRGPLERPSLKLQTIRLSDRPSRLAWLAQTLPELPGHGIIYTLTKQDAEEVARWLRMHDLNVAAYTGDSGDQREALEQALLDNKLKALIATTALGMGFDKPDLAFVIHYQTPGSVVAYYQQVGRAGRALDKAYGVLLSGAEELAITDHFIRAAFPSREEVHTLLDLLGDEPDGLSMPAILSRLNIKYGQLDRALLLLSMEDEPAVAKERGRWFATGQPVGEDFWERASRMTELRRGEQQQMLDYAALTEGHMGFLLRALDDKLDTADPSQLPDLPATVSPALVQKAQRFLNDANMTIEPRKKWPMGGLPLYQRKSFTNIASTEQLSPGRVLALWDDSGWGAQLRADLADGHIRDEIVTAAAELVRAWSPSPAPEWVAYIPTPRRPGVVSSFAKRLAEALDLPLHPALRRVEQRPPQREMANSSYQAKNLDGAFGIHTPPPSGPALLVDDLVSSRWTLAVAAWLLRSNGAGPIHPLALARISPDDND